MVTTAQPMSTKPMGGVGSAEMFVKSAEKKTQPSSKPEGFFQKYGEELKLAGLAVLGAIGLGATGEVANFWDVTDIDDALAGRYGDIDNPELKKYMEDNIAEDDFGSRWEAFWDYEKDNWWDDLFGDKDSKDETETEEAGEGEGGAQPTSVSLEDEYGWKKLLAQEKGFGEEISTTEQAVLDEYYGKAWKEDYLKSAYPDVTDGGYTEDQLNDANVKFDMREEMREFSAFAGDPDSKSDFMDFAMKSSSDGGLGLNFDEASAKYVEWSTSRGVDEDGNFVDTDKDGSSDILEPGAYMFDKELDQSDYENFLGIAGAGLPEFTNYWSQLKGDDGEVLNPEPEDKASPEWSQWNQKLVTAYQEWLNTGGLGDIDSDGKIDALEKDVNEMFISTDSTSSSTETTPPPITKPTGVRAEETK